MKLGRLLVAVSVSVVIAVGVVWSPAAASASALGCGGGAILNIPTGICIDPVSGNPVGNASARSISTATQVRAPSSALAAANGTGGTTAQNVGRATINGADSAGRMFMANKIGVAAYIVAAGVTGYYIGKTATGIACSAGLAALCMPSKSPTYTVNSDVVVTNGDPGWQTLHDGGVIAGYTFGVPAFAAGQTPVLGTGTHGVVVMTSSPSVTSNIPNFIGDTCYGDAATLIPTPTGYGNPAGCGGSSGGMTPQQAAGFDYGPGNAVNGAGAPLYAYYVWIGGDGGNPWSAWVYYPVGSAHHGTTVAVDPARTWQGRNTCTAPGGGTSIITASSAAFHETDSSLPAFPSPGQCPAGTALTVAKVYELSTGLADKLVWSLIVPSGVAAWKADYPQCDGGLCRLGLSKIGPAGSDLGDCFAQAGRCEGWFADASKASDYQCTYGLPGSPANVALSECNIYSPTFDAQQQARGVERGDPATGSTVDVGADPAPDPAPLPGTGGAACWPSGYGVFNPLSWVLMPVKCALVWAFVPDTATVTDALGQTWADVQAKPPMSVVLPLAGTIGTFVGTLAHGCTGNLANFGNGLAVPCDPPSSISSYILALKAMVALAVAGFTGFGLWRYTEQMTGHA